MPFKSYNVAYDKNNPEVVFAEINNLFSITYDLMGEYLKIEDQKNIRMERQITTTMTTGTLVSAPIHGAQQQVVFTRSFAATPQVMVSPIDGNTNTIGAGVKSISTSAATVTLFTTSITGTGKVRAWICGK